MCIKKATQKLQIGYKKCEMVKKVAERWNKLGIINDKAAINGAKYGWNGENPRAKRGKFVTGGKECLQKGDTLYIMCAARKGEKNFQKVGNLFAGTSV